MCVQREQLETTVEKVCLDKMADYYATSTAPLFSCRLRMPEKPGNGIIVFDDTTYNSEASYSCNPGYILTGNGMRICSGSGVWNGTIPICTGEKTL